MTQIYLHIENPKILPPDTEFEHISNIDTHQDGSIDTIIIHDLLDLYENNNINTILNNIKTKIKPGGNLILQSIDLKQMSIAIAFNNIDLQIIKNLLYPFRKSIYTLHEIEKILIDHGFNIINKRYINLFEYYLVVQKNV